MKNRKLCVVAYFSGFYIKFYNYIKSDSTVCIAKTETTTPGKLSVLAQGQAGVGFRLFCNWFVSDFSLLSVSIYLFYISEVYFKVYVHI